MVKGWKEGERLPVFNCVGPEVKLQIPLMRTGHMTLPRCKGNGKLSLALRPQEGIKV